MSEGIPCMWIRGGTSKGGYFLASDLPTDADERNALLLGIMGSPDRHQIDGIGGADPLTSKVAVISPSRRIGVDVDYQFLQVFVDKPIVTDMQNCGNILAGVAPYSIERNLVKASNGETLVTIFMVNSGNIAHCRVKTPNGNVIYNGLTSIPCVPGTASPIAIEFKDIAGSTCGALLPTGNTKDTIDGFDVTMIDYGMPCVLIKAFDLGILGDESPAELESNSILRKHLEKIRIKAGHIMNLGNVAEKSVPKMTIVNKPKNTGSIITRTFIPHTCHKSIGVFGAASVAMACVLPGSIAHECASVTMKERRQISMEHPSGEMSMIISIDQNGKVQGTEVLRTARKLFEGWVFPK